MRKINHAFPVGLIPLLIIGVYSGGNTAILFGCATAAIMLLAVYVYILLQDRHNRHLTQEQYWEGAFNIVIDSALNLPFLTSTITSKNQSKLEKMRNNPSGGVISGKLLISNKGINWQPGFFARTNGFMSSFHINPEKIISFEAGKIEGVHGNLNQQVDITLSDGSTMTAICFGSPDKILEALRRIKQ